MKSLSSLVPLLKTFKGGEGSGFHGHAGRPGKRGGSAPASSSLGDFLEEVKFLETVPTLDDSMKDIWYCYQRDFYDALEEGGIKLPINDDLKFVGLSNGGEAIKVKAEGEKALNQALEEAGIRTTIPGEEKSVGYLLNKSWAHTSNNRGGYQDELQYYASQKAKEAGLKTNETDGMKRIKDNLENASSYHFQDEFTPNERQQIAKIQYDTIKERTQKFLSEKGYGPEDSIVVYRGLRTSQIQKGQILTSENFTQNPLSSWTVDPAIAHVFSDSQGKDSHVIAARVKIKDIFSSWETGFGCASEHEFIIEPQAIKAMKVLL